MVQSPSSVRPETGVEAPVLDPGASRRFFLAGTGALALAATAGASTAWAHGLPVAGASVDGGAVGETDLEAGTVIAYIRPGESEITVISGDREVVVDDPALARAITRTLGGR